MIAGVESESTDAITHTLVQALRQRLGAGGLTVDLIETHISWVLLAGATAWKIKKPVRLGFLDFGTLALRRHFCAEELRLNRRFAPSLYLDVVAITGTPQAPCLGGMGPPIEYALHMVRFAPGALLSEQLAHGSLQPAHLDALAQRLAALHESAAIAPESSAWGSPDEVARQAQGVWQRLQQCGVDLHKPPLPSPAALPPTLCDERLADLQAWLDQQMPLLAPLWQQRRQAGRVRECHGDLHLRNTVVLAEGVTAFDGIEFDPALRWIDVQSDMAFLAMDLLAHDRPALAWRFVNAWLDASGDHAGVPVLRFYLVYRALVRALVGKHSAAADATAVGPSADAYMALARRIAFTPQRPRLLVSHGLSGSGKTHLSQQWLEISGAIRLRSDVERKRLFGLGALQASGARVPGGIYGAEATLRTYDRLNDLARILLQAGHAVIVDAACLRRAERERLQALAGELGAAFTLLDCRADAEVLRQRVHARQQRHDDASEATLQVLEFQRGIDEPLSAQELACAIVVNTDAAIDVAALAAQWLSRAPRGRN